MTTPTEGTIATRFFRICPNNDGGASLPNHARIKIVLLDLNGFPVPDVPAADICVQFNGGTPAQGFSGVGADSIVANSIWNQSPLCPTITCLSADAPTDQNGVTYITFAGSTPGSPGVATRDPQRKWGHYDTELPVYVMGYKLAGRLTSGAANGTYTLRIKNFDVLGGLDDRLNRGAKVSYVDFNAVVQNLNANYCYWYDFDNSGVVTATDLNALIQHLGHDCDTPNNP